jgi:hypothetical protein
MSVSINKLPVDMSFEEEYRLIILNVEPFKIYGTIEFSRSNELIDLVAKIFAMATYHADSYDIACGYINELLQYEDNKYIFAFLVYAETKAGHSKKAKKYLLKSIENGCLEMLNYADKIYLTRKQDHNIINSLLHIDDRNFDQNITHFLDNNITKSNKYKYVLHVLLFKNNQIDQLKIRHEKEIEEILRPDGVGAMMAKQRFIRNADLL